MIEIRAARASDAPALAEIYNGYVASSTATFDEVPRDPETWAGKIADADRAGLPFLVAVEGSALLGYALVTPWSDKSAFRYTVENSIYLAPEAAGRGLGTALLDALLTASRDAGLRQMIAVITSEGTEASLALHRRFGFIETGSLERVGKKFDRWLGVRFLQKDLAESEEH
ncbi:GNAT family N-acetyltransferase [Mycetocola spongiae]|uniref:GNAT family N-acetyltransferase n=1 Tax=Mycetocola spongiae TaxID=2859226 RepID=UPI001CF5FCC5|nr:GNAT family N-acetyltransferase [Mycetocola spongiae]UCR90248.1 GNAT family N-acetyltransferase [Mycetocola spongiae]